MCNAWNHPRGCTCGWGGEGHAGLRGIGSFTNESSNTKFYGVPPINRAYESFVHPNAICPVCGSSVFFYQSPHGGRVFFDELGPPWPKHPCTNNQSIPRQMALSNTSHLEEKSYTWQKTGWKPFFITVVTGVDQYHLRITGQLEGKEIVVYAARVVDSHSKNNPIAPECICQIMPTRGSGSVYDLSLVTTSGKIMSIPAYSTLMDIRARNPTPLRTKNGKKRKNRGITSTSADQLFSHVQKASRHPDKENLDVEPKNTAIALAFKKAEETRH